MNDFLGTARTDLDLAGIRQKLDYLGENKISSPLISRLEFRVRTRDLNISPDDYRLRITPSSPVLALRNRQFQDNAIQSVNDDLQFSLNNALEVRYKLLIRYLYYQERLRLTDQELTLLEDELKIITGESEFGDLAVDDLVETERKITETKVDRSDLQSRLKKIALTMRDLYPFSGDISISFDQLIGVANLNSVVVQIGSRPDTSNLIVGRKKSSLALEQAKYNIKLAETFRNLGFIEAQYRPYRADGFRNQLGFEIGFRIPIFNEDKADHQRTYLNLIEDKADIARQNNRVSLEQQIAMEDVSAAISKYEIIHARMEQLFPGNSLEAYKKQMLKKPEKLLKIKDNQLKMSRDLIDNLEEVYLNYIDFLDVYGKLAESPLKNFLSPALEQF